MPSKGQNLRKREREREREKEREREREREPSLQYRLGEEAVQG